MDITNIRNGVTCPSCKWVGLLANLRVNQDFNVGCPQCKGLITKQDFGLDVHEFMNLPLVAKPFFTCHDAEYNTSYDVMLFDKQLNPDMRCETCGDHEHELASYLFGTSGVQGPKFCPQHFEAMNKNCRFIKEED